ncbi:hypothetical protein RvY_11436 [Ramazzottius varieornatus]|uniref:Protein kinase domain-containing protein n=1 Tax=Ramazzottius varieornatus TaxID=947166 RepID=A0A1D1VG59_RAMVA|nr:hypothetical protein RvY_11436 [Ramazzottius varieornatus]
MGACMKQSHDRHQQVIITSLLSRALPTSTASAGASITLHDLIHDQRGKNLSTPYKVQLNRTLIIASQISQGMGYLHRRGIVHKNLKSRNVFVTHEKCVITDYGLFSISKMSQHGRSDDLLWIPKNWLCYLAPELCQKLQTPRQHKLAFQRHRAVHDSRTPFGLPFNVASDVYAFGTILYELCTGAFPNLWSATNAQRLNTSSSTSSIQSGLMTPLSDTPNTPGMLGPPTPMSLSSMPLRMPRPADPNLPGSLEAAFYLIASGTHPIFRLFRSRQLNVSHRSAASTATTPPSSQLGRHLIQTPTLTSPPMSLAMGTNTPPTPVHTPTNLLSPSLEEAAARELTELISVCWSVQPQFRREFPDVYQMLEKVPKKNLARSPSHPVHGNAPFPKDNMYHH